MAFKVIQIADENFSANPPYIHALVDDPTHKIVMGLKIVNHSVIESVFNKVKSFITDLNVTERSEQFFTIESKIYDLTLFFEADSDKLLIGIESGKLNKGEFYKLLEIMDTTVAELFNASNMRKRRMSEDDDGSSYKRSRIGAKRRKTRKTRKTKKASK